MYPGYLVLATSAAGLAVCRRLQLSGRIHPAAAWALLSMYGAKVGRWAVADIHSLS
jgi:hypothetical protein